MFSFFYDLVLFLVGLLALPKLLLDAWRHGKYRKSIKERLGMHLPSLSKGEHPLIWIHTVSVGETRAVIPLFYEIKKAYPLAKVIISTTTETGQLEARRSMKEADAHFFLPLDFSFLSKKVVNKYQPDMLILVESDFWYHLLKYTKKRGGKVVLVNGKISERSFKRFKIFSFLAKRLFSLFDLFCVQSPLYANRFFALGVPKEKIHSTGNLKFDQSAKGLNPNEIAAWKDSLGIKEDDLVLTIGSTHDPEEEELLLALKPLWEKIPHLKVLIVPRHPERFIKVAKLLQDKGIPFISYSEKEKKTTEEKVILIDAMGLLNICYQLADVAIVAGSFTDKVGGHNIFEPVNFSTPVLFGPHMHTQQDLVSLVLEAKAGLQVTLETLPSILLNLLENPVERKKIATFCEELAEGSRGSTSRTFEIIKRRL